MFMARKHEPHLTAWQGRAALAVAAGNDDHGRAIASRGPG
jgi:hypothetical protein